MNVVHSKYRGTPLHAAVLAELIASASTRSYLPYDRLASLMRLPKSGEHTARELGIMLGEISEDEVDAGRPMLSAIAVGATGKPGNGFYTLAFQLGVLRAGADEHLFWQQQCEAVFASRRQAPPSA